MVSLSTGDYVTLGVYLLLCAGGNTDRFVSFCDIGGVVVRVQLWECGPADSSGKHQLKTISSLGGAVSICYDDLHVH